MLRTIPAQTSLLGHASRFASLPLKERPVQDPRDSIEPDPLPYPWFPRLGADTFGRFTGTSKDSTHVFGPLPVDQPLEHRVRRPQEVALSDYEERSSSPSQRTRLQFRGSLPNTQVDEYHEFDPLDRLLNPGDHVSPRSFGPLPPPSRPPPRIASKASHGNIVRSIFSQFDRNGTGRLDYRELRNALEAMGVNVTAAEAAYVLGRYSNGLGLMEFDEFKRMATRLGYDSRDNIPLGVRAVFQQFDRNGTGRLDHRELRNVLHALGVDVSAVEAASVLRRYDGGSGLMEIDEFARLAARLGYVDRHGDGSGGDSIPFNVRAVFRQFDRNGTGRLDYRELRNALSAMGVDVTDSEAASVLGRYDSGSGLMELDEFARLATRLGYVDRGGGDSIPFGVQKIFQSFDRNGTGRLDYRELRSAMQAIGVDVTAVQAASVLVKYDSGSGLMELDEFAQLAMRLGYSESAADDFTRLRRALPRSSEEDPSVPRWLRREYAGAVDSGRESARNAIAFPLSPRVGGRPFHDPGYPPQSYTPTSGQTRLHVRGSLPSSELPPSDLARLNTHSIKDTFDRSLSPTPLERRARSIFQQFDRNGTGHLDYFELRNALAALGVNVTTAEAASVLARYDSGSGLLELDEFTRLSAWLDYANENNADSIPLDVRSTFQQFDLNGTRRLDYRELRNALRAMGVDVTTAEAASVLARYDSGSGLMELDEFALLVKHLGYVEGGKVDRSSSSMYGRAQESISNRVRSIFRQFDRNGTGRLDYRELRNALQAMGVRTTEADAASVLRNYGGSGMMELEEFARLATRLGYEDRAEDELRRRSASPDMSERVGGPRNNFFYVPTVESRDEESRSVANAKPANPKYADRYWPAEPARGDTRLHIRGALPCSTLVPPGALPRLRSASPGYQGYDPIDDPERTSFDYPPPRVSPPTYNEVYGPTRRHLLGSLPDSSLTASDRLARGYSRDYDGWPLARSLPQIPPDIGPGQSVAGLGPPRPPPQPPASPNQLFGPLPNKQGSTSSLARIF